MATGRKRRSRGRPVPFGSQLLGWIGFATLPLIGGVSVFLGVQGFVGGRYVTGRTGGSSSVREAWNAYGDGAYAGESPVHLITIAFGLTMLVAFVVLARAQIRRDVPDLNIIGAVGGILFASGSVASLILLIANWSSGVPFHNFHPTGVDEMLYALWCFVPLLVLGFLIFFGVTAVRHRSTHRRSAEAPDG